MNKTTKMTPEERERFWQQAEHAARSAEYTLQAMLRLAAEQGYDVQRIQDCWTLTKQELPK